MAIGRDARYDGVMLYIPCDECQWPSLCDIEGDCVVVWFSMENFDVDLEIELLESAFDSTS